MVFMTKITSAHIQRGREQNGYHSAAAAADTAAAAA